MEVWFTVYSVTVEVHLRRKICDSESGCESKYAKMKVRVSDLGGCGCQV